MSVLTVGGPAPPAWDDGAGSIENRLNRSWERSDVPGMVAVVVQDDRIDSNPAPTGCGVDS